MNPISQSLDLTVVAPAHNEAENLPQLVEQIVRALDPLGIEYEIIVIDDDSTDSTKQVLSTLQQEYQQLHPIHLIDTNNGRGVGQSAAFAAGFQASRGEIIASLDADLQNDPADLPALLELLQRSDADMIQGDRSGSRRDGFSRNAVSFIGRTARRILLGDDIRDTGCSLRVMRRCVAQALPLEYRGLHRFIPYTARRLGFTVIEMPVNHRPRIAGTTNYGSLDRALAGFVDCLAVRWMSKRHRSVRFEAIDCIPDKIHLSADAVSPPENIAEENPE